MVFQMETSVPKMTLHKGSSMLDNLMDSMELGCDFLMLILEKITWKPCNFFCQFLYFVFLEKWFLQLYQKLHSFAKKNMRNFRNQRSSINVALYKASKENFQAPSLKPLISSIDITKHIVLHYSILNVDLQISCKFLQQLKNMAILSWVTSW
jgi:hypothetical protein